MFITNIYSKNMFNIVSTIIHQHYQTGDQNILVKFLSFLRKEKQIFFINGFAPKAYTPQSLLYVVASL